MKRFSLTTAIVATLCILSTVNAHSQTVNVSVTGAKTAGITKEGVRQYIIQRLEDNEVYSYNVDVSLSLNCPTSCDILLVYSIGNNSGTEQFSNSPCKKSFVFSKIDEILDKVVGMGSGSSGNTDETIASQISGESQGYKYGMLFKLTNGQIWEQTDGWFFYFFQVMPEVTIFQIDGVMKLQIEGLDKAVTVQRIR